MAKRKRKKREEIFRAEVPMTIWPPTLTQRPSAFVRALNQVWGRGMSILGGASLVGLGFFVWDGEIGMVLGGLGLAMIVGALIWHRWRGS